MEDTDKIKQRFELIKIARELLNEDYINRRAEDHNKWVAENDELWRTKRRNLPYPPFAQYPTDDEIVRAASNLYNFIYRDKEDKSDDSSINTEALEPKQSSGKPFAQGDYVFPELAEKTHASETIIQQPPNPEPKPEPEPIKELTVAESSPADQETVIPDPTLKDIKEKSAELAVANSTLQNLLPGWVRRSKTT
jgi:hypothetical protein